MKPSDSNPCLRLLGLLTAAACLQAAPLTIDPQVFSGGGGSGRTSRFQLDGSIGLAVAESQVTQVGNRGLRAGFWSQVVPWLETSPPGELTVEVAILPGPPATVRLRGAGVAGRTYAIQTAANPAGPWTTATSLVAAVDGSLVYAEALGSGARFFRLVEVTATEKLAVDIQLLAGPPPAVRLQGHGVAGRSYLIQTAANPGGPWVASATLVAAGDGTFELTEILGSGARFFRLAE